MDKFLSVFYNYSAKTESMYTLFVNIYIYFVVIEIMILLLQWCVEFYTL